CRVRRGIIRLIGFGVRVRSDEHRSEWNALRIRCRERVAAEFESAPERRQLRAIAADMAHRARLSGLLRKARQCERERTCAQSDGCIQKLPHEVFVAHHVTSRAQSLLVRRADASSHMAFAPWLKFKR